jgi:hypothetical protein
LPEILLGISLCVTLIVCITLYGQRENLARELGELEDEHFRLGVEFDNLVRRSLASLLDASRVQGSTGDLDLDHLVGSGDPGESMEK